MRIRSVWFRGGGGGGRHMLARGHGCTAGGRHWAGGLHSGGMLLLVGTGDTGEQEQRMLFCPEGLQGYIQDRFNYKNICIHFRIYLQYHFIIESESAV